jgi:uncharacterized tellurite resistance protein B-like protein
MDSVIGAVKEFFSDDNLSGLEQSQNEAIVEALVAAMVSDHEIKPSEKQELASAAERLDWKGSVSTEKYIEEAKGRAKEAMRSGWLEFLGSVSDRLGEQWLRRDCYYLSARLAGVDNIMDESESDYLRAMVSAFNIDSDELTQITSTLRDEIDF